jgi:hypothetical protein
MWRKNRNPNSGKGHFGVDLNRNFEIGFGIGASSSESSQTYKGKHALSEPEALAVARILNSTNFVAGIDFHSYSQLLLRPWGYKYEYCKDEELNKKVGAEMVAAIKNKHNMVYDNIRSVELYPSGGAIDDHMYGAAGIFGFTFELRDKGYYGFLLPPEQIIPTCEEIWEAVMVFCQHF